MWLHRVAGQTVMWPDFSLYGNVLSGSALGTKTKNNLADAISESASEGLGVHKLFVTCTL